MHRRQRRDGGQPVAAPVSRGAGQRDLGGQRQRPVPRLPRAIQRSPQTLEAFFAEVGFGEGRNAALDRDVVALKDDTGDLGGFEARGRGFCDRLALGLQAAALVRAGSPVGDDFCRRGSRRGARTTMAR